MSTLNAAEAGSGWSGLFWQAFRRSRNAMVLLDEHRRLVDVNGGALQLIGYRRQDLIGRPAADLVPGGPLMSKRQWQDLLRRKQFTGTAEVMTADGGRIRAEFAGHPEIVTGRQLVLVVALKTARATRRLPDHEEPSQGPRSLSSRELEVIRLIALGFSGPEIADELQLAHNTVRSHARNSMTKVSARSRAHLVAKALGEGLLWD